MCISVHVSTKGVFVCVLVSIADPDWPQNSSNAPCRYIPERLLHARGTPRCIFLILISALSALAVCFNAFASLQLLFPASIMAGLAFGATWSLMATLTSEFFGLHHFASNYTFIQVCQHKCQPVTPPALHCACGCCLRSAFRFNSTFRSTASGHAEFASSMCMSSQMIAQCHCQPVFCVLMRGMSVCLSPANVTLAPTWYHSIVCYAILASA